MTGYALIINRLNLIIDTKDYRVPNIYPFNLIRHNE